MSTNLYQVLGISPNATPEEVRKAYRKKALATHPDRLHQGASAAEKSAHEDLFRKVNNAYEVLSDPQSRATYDQHGVWPPPTAPGPAPQGPFANGPHDSFSSPFFHDPFPHDPFFRGARMDPFGGFGSRHGSRGFTDPFVLFNSIFGDLHRAFENDPFFDDPFGRHGFESSPFGNGFFNTRFLSAMPSPFDHSRGIGSSRVQISSNAGNGGRWASESWTSSTVNGVTHTKCVRKDSQGNEHVIYRYPDGTERRTVNGIEQSATPPLRALPPTAPPAPPVAFPTPTTGMPALPPYSEAAAQSSHRSHSSRHHNHYDDYPRDRHDHRDRHRHDRHDYPSRDGRGYRDDKQGREPQSGSAWNIWRS